MRSGDIIKGMSQMESMSSLVVLNVHTIATLQIHRMLIGYLGETLEKEGTDRPPVPLYFTVSLLPDLRVALARFRLSAHNLKAQTG